MQPTLSHWVDHLTTLFREVRVKRVLESAAPTWFRSP